MAQGCGLSCRVLEHVAMGGLLESTVQCIASLGVPMKVYIITLHHASQRMPLESAGFQPKSRRTLTLVHHGSAQKHGQRARVSGFRKGQASTLRAPCTTELPALSSTVFVGTL